MRYVTGVNNAGYLPEMTPNEWETLAEAKEDLIMLILEDADYHSELDEWSIHAETLTSYAEDVNLWDHCAAIHYNGREYWISESSND